MARYCYKCGLQLREGARFCHACGAEARALPPESQLENDESSSITANSGTKPSFIDRMKVKLKDAKKDGVSRIDSYLDSLDRRNEISGVKLTEGRREFLRSRLIGLRERLAENDSDLVQEEWKTLSVALETLPEDLIDEKCIICLKPVSEAPKRQLAFCPHCLRGGHQEHLAEWIKIKGTCPICREDITPMNLVQYQTPIAKI
ncbi:MAG: zinc-ribbon domain-containing protein [Candidatus Hodarchaeales archaeon]|jgi:hypothetical protein